MVDPLELRGELEPALALAAREAALYASALPGEPVAVAGTDQRLAELDMRLTDAGTGAVEALAELAALGRANATRSSGPRFFHFVMGGTTPAALGGDWLTSTFDQVAYAWASSPLASRLEAIAVDWLRDLLELPSGLSGVLVSGATMANFTGLAAARGWWAARLGIAVDEAGLTGAPRPRILTSGYVHPSSLQAVGMLGLGRANVEQLRRDRYGRLDIEALAEALADDAPAIVIANAGEVNAGDFDPLAEIAALTSEHDAWLHVDGAFGMFARVAPESRHLTEGVEHADSITIDAHKWLNVPYDCGISFVREPGRLAQALNVGAPYLPLPEDPRPNFGFTSPENSRRARALAIWATLRAYGRDGHREMVERHLRLARLLAERVDAEPTFERLAPVQLNIVCFRARPPSVPESELDQVNRRLGAALLEEGRVFCGTTTYGGQVAFRPAICNWQTSDEDVMALIDVLVELLDGLE